MKLAVIGDPKRKSRDVIILKQAEEIFSDAVYIPVDEIQIEVGKFPGKVQILFEDRPISFNCIFPIPTIRYFDIFSVIVEGAKESHVPYTFPALVRFQKKYIGLSWLKNLGYFSTDFSQGISEALNYRAKEFPITVEIGGNLFVAKDRADMKAFLKTRRPGQGIVVRPHESTRLLESFIIGEKVVSTLEIDAESSKAKRVRIDPQFKEHIGSAVKFLGSEYGTVTTQENKIVSISLSPDFQMFHEKSRAPVIKDMLRYIKESVDMKMTVFESITDSISGLLRRLA